MSKLLIIIILISLNIFLSLNNSSNSTSIDLKNNNDTKNNASNAPQKVDLKMELNSREGIYNIKNPIMLEIAFVNNTNLTQKLCTYKFEESLLKLDVRNIKGKKIEFATSLIKSESISDINWIAIQPGRKYKRIMSLSRKILELTGKRISPGHYKIKATYEGCSKFDNRLPSVNIESNSIYLMITE